MANRCMLSTIDNPINPFDDYLEWWRFDTSHGYNSSAYLVREMHTSEQFSDEEDSEEMERAIDEILKRDPTNLYIKVTPETKIDPKKQKALLEKLFK